MLNQVMLVGKQKGNIVKEKDKTYINLAVARPYKNKEGIYDTDVIKCELYNNVASNIEEYCRDNDLLGVRGRVQVYNDIQTISVEKLTFLSNKKQEA